MPWQNITNMGTKRYVCGYCGEAIASQVGYHSQEYQKIYLCHNCNQPTYFSNIDKQVPGYAYGSPVKDIPDVPVNTLYEEARNCTAAGAHTAAVLCSRKLLMNITVEKGAAAGLPFVDYIKYLSDQGYVPPGGKDWVDHIRKKGNEATHEIAVMNKEDAEELISFSEMLLKFIYEFPAKMKKKISPPPPAASS